MEWFCNAQGKQRQFAVFTVIVLLTAFFAGFLPTPSFATDFTARHIGDFGNVTVMQVAGNYDAEFPDASPNDDPRQLIAQEFYKTHKDEYDFLIVFTDFDFKMPKTEAIAFYLQVKNDVQGIGLEQFDNSPFFGSAGKLQGTIDMGNLANNVADPLDPRFEHTLGTLNHEVLHRWGAFLKLADSSGPSGNALLGQDGDHWSYLLDTKGSLHYGSRWQDNGNGTFTATETRTYFSPLDLYVMGMLDPREVPPMLLIENSALDQTKIPLVGTTISGTPRTVTIEEIIVANGERIPAAAEAQKNFMTAFLYVTAAGTFSPADLHKLETIRNGFLTRFSVLTDGQALVQVAPALKDELAVNPGVAPVNSAPRTLPPTLDEGITWLLGNQRPDGSWLDAEATRLRDTTEAITALRTFGGSGSQIDLGMNWLDAGVVANTDYLARRIEAGVKSGADISPLLTDLLSRQNADGGWGLSRHFSSTPTDAALALKALARADHAGPAVAKAVTKAVTYLTQQQNADGGWSETAGASLIQPTANALLALNRYRSSYPLDEPVALGAAFLQQKQNSDGGFGNSPSTIYDSAAALLALNELGASASLASRGVDYLIARQTENGSWYDSSYQTAMAVQAVYQTTVLPDLAISSTGISFIPEKIVKLPANAMITVEMANLGRTAVPQAVVVLYLGSGAEAVRIDEQVIAFPAESSVVVTFAVPVLEGRDHLFTVVIDPDQLVEEQSVANNRAAKFLRPESTYDFVLAASDLTVSANPVRIFENVGVSATVRNAGTSDAFNVPVRFYIEDGGDTIQIATRTVDIRANGSALVDATWTAGRAGVLTVVAEVDSNNAFPENDENNNRASRPLLVNSSTLPNLAVDFADLLVTPNPARQGGRATIAAVVSNQGFSAAAQVTAAVYLGVPGGDFAQLGSRVIPRLDPGQSAAITVDWENIPDFGNRIILVRIDPDNLIAEIQKDDNEAVITLPILSLPDLVLPPGAVEVAPATPKEGDEVVVHVTILNAGDQEARDLVVNLYESTQLLSTRTLAAISGHTQASLLFPYPATTSSGVHELTVVVDAENLIPEVREDNNAAVATVTIQNANLWLSERYISPNGDGVQDETRFGFRLDSPASVSVTVVNGEGKTVRTFAAVESQASEGESVVWDGKGDEGMVEPDGLYQLQVKSAMGNVLASVQVVVDNNLLPFAAAVGTPYIFEQIYDLPPGLNFHRIGPDETSIILESYGGSGQPPRGYHELSLTDKSITYLNPKEFVYPLGLSGTSIDFSSGGEIAVLAVDANDKSLSNSSGPAVGQLWVYNRENKTWLMLEENRMVTPWYDVTRIRGSVRMPYISPDGKKIIYQKLSYARKNWGEYDRYDLCIINIDGTGATVLINNYDGYGYSNGNGKTVVWSPDSEMVAICIYNELFIYDLNGNQSKIGDIEYNTAISFITNSLLGYAKGRSITIVDIDKRRDVFNYTGVDYIYSFLSKSKDKLIIYDRNKSLYKIIEISSGQLLFQFNASFTWQSLGYEYFNSDSQFWDISGKLFQMVGVKEYYVNNIGWRYEMYAMVLDIENMSGYNYKL